MPDARVTVLIVAEPGIETRPLADSLSASSALTVATVGSGSLTSLADSVPGGRFVFLAGSEHDPPLDELDQLGPERWFRVDRDRLIADSRSELQRLCGFLGIAYDQALLSPVEAVRRAVVDSADASSPFCECFHEHVRIGAAAGRQLAADLDLPDPPPGVRAGGGRRVEHPPSDQ